ncbi:MAG: nuclear transport factor 2 family protein [Planctomycetota bacterium]
MLAAFTAASSGCASSHESNHSPQATLAADDRAADHRAFWEWFKTFWAEPSGERVAERFLPDSRIHFTGIGTITGAEYIGIMDGLLAAQPELKVTPVDYAGSGDIVYIHWRATSTIDGARRAWYGVDRFRLNDHGMVVEEHVIYDSALLEADTSD